MTGGADSAGSDRGAARPTGAALLLLVVLLLMSSLHAAAGYSHAGVSVSGHAWGTDDAYIAYRYARNLVNGHGLVFNPGERVEGYSNLLYVLIMSVVFLISDQHAYLCSVLLNLLFIAIAFVLFHRHVQRQLGARMATLSGLLFALCPPVWLWVASGMETPLVLLLTLAIWIAVEAVVETGGPRDVVVLCAAMVLSMLTRADGFVVPVIAMAYLLLKRRWAIAAWCGCTVVGTMGTYVLWRYAYYGYLLPNTYYAKVAGPLAARLSSGASQLSRLALHQSLLAYLLVFLLVIGRTLVSKLRPARRAYPLRFPALFAAGWLLYWLYIGGDTFDERFLVVLFPLGIYEMARSLSLLRGRRAVVILVGLVLLHEAGCVMTDPRFAYSFTKYDRWVELGRFLGVRHPGQTLAIDAAGKVPFFSGLPTLDMLGLTDAFIAHKPVQYFRVAGHDKFDTAYVLSRRPDLIAAWSGGGRDLGWGLTRRVYEGAGYRLRYLVNAKKEAASDGRGNIIDVKDADDRTITGLINAGYWYVVLDRDAA